MKAKDCKYFANWHCSTDDCPNIQYDACEQHWGFGVPYDIGMHRIRCRDCIYYDKRCTCDDCLFKGRPECPETEEKQ